MAAPPNELLLRVAQHADVPTLKCLRLVSKSVAALVSPYFAIKALPYVNIQITEIGLQTLLDMSTSTYIGPYIKNIGINTQAPRHSTVCDMRRWLRKHPTDQHSRASETVKHFSAALAEYVSLCSSGRVVDRIQAAFENLRRNYNNTLRLEIWDDGDRNCIGHREELNAMDGIDSTKSPERGFPWPGAFVFDQQNQSRVLLALARSGLGIEELRISTKPDITTHPWSDICDNLRERDNIGPRFRCDSLSNLRVRKLHINVDLDCDSWDGESEIVIGNDSAISCVLKHAEGLTSLSLEDQGDTHGFDRLLLSLPRQRWSSVRLGFLSLQASTLSSFWCVNSLRLDMTELIGVQLIHGDKQMKVKDVRLSLRTCQDDNGDKEVVELREFLGWDHNFLPLVRHLGFDKVEILE